MLCLWLSKEVCCQQHELPLVGKLCNFKTQDVVEGCFFCLFFSFYIFLFISSYNIDTDRSANSECQLTLLINPSLSRTSEQQGHVIIDFFYNCFNQMDRSLLAIRKNLVLRYIFIIFTFHT